MGADQMSAISRAPRISVLMSVYNTEKYVGAAIESILSQTFGDFEFLVVDDGSTDNSVEVIKHYTDRRLVLFRNERNMGVVYSLNLIQARARGEFVAHMDSDDISLPKRFEEQVAFMDARSDIAACGTWYRTFGSGKSFVRRMPTQPEDVTAGLLFYQPVHQPASLIRRTIIEKHQLQYRIRLHRDKNFTDYDFWSRLAQAEPVANIPRPLLLYRLHSASVSAVHRRRSREVAALIRKELLIGMSLSPSEQELVTHHSVRPKEGKDILSFLREKETWFIKILEANELSHKYDPKSLHRTLSERWRIVCSLNSRLGLSVWNIYRRSEFSTTQSDWPLLRRFLLFVRCLLHR